MEALRPPVDSPGPEPKITRRRSSRRPRVLRLHPRAAPRLPLLPRLRLLPALQTSVRHPVPRRPPVDQLLLPRPVDLPRPGPRLSGLPVARRSTRGLAVVLAQAEPAPVAKGLDGRPGGGAGRR